MDRKPNVFPNREQRDAADERAKIAAFEAEKAKATQEIYVNSMAPDDTPNGHVSAVDAMRMRTEQQMMMREQYGVVQDPSLADKPAPRQLTKSEQEVLEIRKKAEEQMRIRDEHLAMNANQTKNYQNQYNEAETRKQAPMVPTTPVQQPVAQQPQNYGKVPTSVDNYIIQLSQPNFNSSFDVIPLPSEGKVYKSKKPSVKVSYMTTADESILTSPNLLESGQFLEILINRKLLETDIRYEDLLVGDRNAIMIWLRATAYGEMYPVTLFDENDVPFDTDINLNDLKFKNLGAEADAEGLFDFTMPLSKNQIKFKLVTCGMTDEIERLLKQEKENGVPVNNTATYTMERMIVEVNGNRDKNFIRDFVQNIRIADSKAFMEYVEKINCGVDMDITVQTPGGGSIKTFLPLNLHFFWPDFKL
jgi:hypothetical protein